MSDFEDFYREVILDHYKHPRNYGTIEEPHAHAEGQNPLCGDEVAIDLTFDGDDKMCRGEFWCPREAERAEIIEISARIGVKEIISIDEFQIMAWHDAESPYYDIVKLDPDDELADAIMDRIRELLLEQRLAELDWNGHEVPVVQQPAAQEVQANDEAEGWQRFNELADISTLKLKPESLS